MTREEEIKKIACSFAIDEVKDTCNPASKRGLLYAGFVAGAEWADSHPHWISVEDELPPKDGRYLFYDEFLGPRVSAYYVECTLAKEITHWLPLPQAPKKGGEE